MTCFLSPKKWWQDYIAGRLRTPQAIYSAAHNDDPDNARSDDRVFDVSDPGPTWDAPARLKASNHFSTNSYLRQIERADWALCDPRLLVWSALFTEMAKKRGIPLYVHCALRNEAEQNRVYNAGNSKAKYGQSAHNIGEAVDIVHGVFHWEMNRSEWALLEVLGRLALDKLNATLKKDNKLSLTWGGSFKSIYDPAHWEITDFRSRRRPLSPVKPLRFTPKLALQQRHTLLQGL